MSDRKPGCVKKRAGEGVQCWDPAQEPPSFLLNFKCSAAHGDSRSKRDLKMADRQATTVRAAAPGPSGSFADLTATAREATSMTTRSVLDLAHLTSQHTYLYCNTSPRSQVAFTLARRAVSTNETSRPLHERNSRTTPEWRMLIDIRQPRRGRADHGIRSGRVRALVKIGPD